MRLYTRKPASLTRLPGTALAVCLGLASAISCSHSTSTSTAAPDSLSSSGSSAVFTAPLDKAEICGKPILNSPYDYNGVAGSYSSGTPGLPTYGKPGSNFPKDTAGVVLPRGKNNYLSYELKPDTVYYLLPGKHTGYIQANKNDAFVGGRSKGISTVLSGDYSDQNWAIDSNSSDGDQSGVTIEYLTVEKYVPRVDSAAINPDANTHWTIRHNTFTLNVPGAAVILGSDGVLTANCMTLNGQYGFQSVASNAWARDTITDGPYNLTVEGNEISYNDTCDLSGQQDNAAIGWSKHNPVPVQYRNSRCGQVAGDGNQGGFKLWHTDGVTIKGNYIHDNWGTGGWADTNNANTTWTGNTITGNEGPAITEETSYNFSITDNYIAGNDIIDGLGNSKFPSPAIYISESGSDRQFGGVPACPETSCSSQPSYSRQSVISGNTLVNNGGNIFLWQNSTRYCSGPLDRTCTLVGAGQPFTMSSCHANLPTASFDTATMTSKATGSPARDWVAGCTWKTENVSITRNTIDFNPADIMHCTQAAWPDCGARRRLQRVRHTAKPPTAVGRSDPDNVLPEQCME